ncbi:MAG: hypothetical protein SFV51_20105 [Bryobacteraceae bacterium]|nr:hypothetical protein [Bryobacteraceae bacterium]
MSGANPASTLAWAGPFRIEEVRANRALIPSQPGVYVFTLHPGPLVDSLGVLYVGKASALSSRLPSYLADPEDIRILSPRKKDGSLNRSLRHAGKNQLLMEIQQKARGGALSGIWLRWTIRANPQPLEETMIQFFQPAFNTAGL